MIGEDGACCLRGMLSQKIYTEYLPLYSAQTSSESVYTRCCCMVTEVWEDINRGKFAVQKSLFL